MNDFKIDVPVDDVLKQVLVEHREVLPWELEATFGPCWMAVVDIVRQAAAPTALDAAGVAARAAAWDAVGAAAGAAACHDLIGQNGFTQDHYDLLVAPWESVMGPINYGP